LHGVKKIKPTREQIVLSLAKSRPGVEIKLDAGRVMAKLDFMKVESAWAVLAYENEIHFNVTGSVNWRGWEI
jgi:hypothetical protein